jgi:hypothetical protein
LMLDSYYGTSMTNNGKANIESSTVTFNPGFGVKLSQEFAIGVGGMYSYDSTVNTTNQKQNNQDRAGCYLGAFWTPGDYISISTRPSAQFLIDSTAGSRFNQLEVFEPLSADFLVDDRKLLIHASPTVDMNYDYSWSLATTYSIILGAEYWLSDGFSLTGIGAAHLQTTLYWNGIVGFSLHIFGPATLYANFIYESVTPTSDASAGVRAFIDWRVK